MAFEQGIIESVSAHQAQVRMRRSSACASCGSRHMCYGGANDELLVEIDNALEAKVGDRVEISMPTGSLLGLSLLVYLVPIVALLVGAYVGQALSDALGAEPTPAAIVGGAVALVAAFLGLKRFDRSAVQRRRYVPKMTRILPPEQPISCQTQHADNR